MYLKRKTNKQENKESPEVWKPGMGQRRVLEGQMPVGEPRGSSDTGYSVPRCIPCLGGCSPTRAPELKMFRTCCTLAPSWQFTTHCIERL